MLGLMIAIILYNSLAFLTNKRHTKNQIVHIWTFTIALQVIVDMYLSVEYLGYWYFTKDATLADLLVLIFVIPPVNRCF